MKKTTLLTLLALACWCGLPFGQAYAQGPKPQRFLSATDTGLNGATIASSAAVTSTIPMRASGQYGRAQGWELHLTGVVTAGTSASMDVSCEESHDNTTWAFVHHCTDAAIATCAIQYLRYDISTTATVSVVLKTRAPYVRCTFDDLADGSGTIVVTGTVSTLAQEG